MDNRNTYRYTNAQTESTYRSASSLDRLPTGNTDKVSDCGLFSNSTCRSYQPATLTRSPTGDVSLTTQSGLTNRQHWHSLQLKTFCNNTKRFYQPFTVTLFPTEDVLQQHKAVLPNGNMTRSPTGDVLQQHKAVIPNGNIDTVSNRRRFAVTTQSGLTNRQHWHGLQQETFCNNTKRSYQPATWHGLQLETFCNNTKLSYQPAATLTRSPTGGVFPTKQTGPTNRQTFFHDIPVLPLTRPPTGGVSTRTRTGLTANTVSNRRR